MKKLICILIMLCAVSLSAQTRPSWTDIKNKPMINVMEYGATGDGVTNDAPKIQAALDAAASLSTMVYFPTPKNFYHVTYGLTARCAGIVMETNNYSGTIRCFASGTTILTVTSVGKFFAMNLSVGSDRSVPVNGIRFLGGATPVFHVSGNNIRVYACDGFGLRIDDIWDSAFFNTSVQYCGNTSEYAFSVISNSPHTSNETGFYTLQVEQSQGLGIYNSPNALNMSYTNVHCERNAAGSTSVLTGNGLVVNGLRFTASGPGVTLFLGAYGGQYNALRIEGAPSVRLGYGVAGAFYSFHAGHFIDSTLAYDVSATANRITFDTCKIKTYKDGIEHLSTPETYLQTFRNCDISEVSISNPFTSFAFYDSYIAKVNIAPTSVHASIFLSQSEIASFPSTIDCGSFRLRAFANSTLPNTSIAAYNNELTLRDSMIGTVSVGGDLGMFKIEGSTVTAISIATGSHAFLFDSSCNITNPAVPTAVPIYPPTLASSTYLASGTTTFNPLPDSGETSFMYFNGVAWANGTAIP